MKDIKSRNLYQLCPEPTNSEEYRIWNIRGLALPATSFDSPASTWFNSVSETDGQDWFIFSTKFPKQFDSETIKFKTQAEAKNFQFATHESYNIFACRVENIVKKRWPAFDSKMRNREVVKTVIQGLPFKLR